MKSLASILFVVCFLFAQSQNLEDAYESHGEVHFWPNDEINQFDGEYQIFLDKFFWNANFNQDNNLEPAPVSFSIEVVSFPFIPENFDPDGLISIVNSEERNLNCKIASDFDFYGNITSTHGPDEFYYSGRGWEYGEYLIYQKLYNVNTCDKPDQYMCQGDYGLITQAYKNNLLPGPNCKCRHN